MRLFLTLALIRFHSCFRGGVKDGGMNDTRLASLPPFPHPTAPRVTPGPSVLTLPLKIPHRLKTHKTFLRQPPLSRLSRPHVSHVWRKELWVMCAVLCSANYQFRLLFSICPSVCPSVCQKRVLAREERKISCALYGLINLIITQRSQRSIAVTSSLCCNIFLPSRAISQ